MAYRIKHGDVTIEADSAQEAASVASLLNISTEKQPAKASQVPGMYSVDPLKESTHSIVKPGQVWRFGSGERLYQVLKTFADVAKVVECREDGTLLPQYIPNVIAYTSLLKDYTLLAVADPDPRSYKPRVDVGQVWCHPHSGDAYRVIEHLSPQLIMIQGCNPDGTLIEHEPVKIGIEALKNKYYPVRFVEPLIDKVLRETEVVPLVAPKSTKQTEPKPVEGGQQRYTGKLAADCGVKVGQRWVSKNNHDILVEITSVFPHYSGGKLYEKVGVKYIGPEGLSNRHNWSMRVSSLVYKYQKKPAKVKPPKKTAKQTTVTVTSEPTLIYDPKGTSAGYSTKAVQVLQSSEHKVEICNTDGTNPRWILKETLKKKYNPRV